MLGAARDESVAPVVADYDGRLMQLVVVPVRAPDTIGWVGMGFLMRDFVAEQIKAISGTDVTFIAQNGAAPRTLSASTIAPARRSVLERQLRALPGPGAPAGLMELQGEAYLTKVVAVAINGGQSFCAVLQLPERSVSAPLQALRHDLLVWAGPATIVCLVAALLCARVLSRPVQALASGRPQSDGLEARRRDRGAGRRRRVEHRRRAADA